MDSRTEWSDGPMDKTETADSHSRSGAQIDVLSLPGPVHYDAVYTHVYMDNVCPGTNFLAENDQRPHTHSDFAVLFLSNRAGAGSG